MAKQCMALIAVGLLLTTIEPSFGCTVFVASDGNVTLAGDNEDFDHSYTQMWTVPATDDTYGVVYFGFGRGEYPAGGASLSERAVLALLGSIPLTEVGITDLYGYPQQGINEKGLFFGGAATEVVSFDSRKRQYTGVLIDYILKHSRNVNEARELIKKYNFPSPQGQLLFGDPTGSSFIWEAGGSVITGTGSFQIITNFLQSRHPDEKKRDRRYKIVDEELKTASAISRDLVRSILDETHQSITQYSIVIDLTHLTVDLYQKRDFSKAVTLDIRDQIKKPPHSFRITTLFQQLSPHI
jgi:hypothetical protein